MVKRLREQSGAPIVECRDAITQALKQSSSAPLSDSELLSLATDLLRKKGIATASKKSGRTASEGLVAVAVSADHRRAAVVELNSETDFAARNDRFQATLHTIAQTALSSLQPSPAAEDSPDQAAATRLLSAQAEGKSVQDVLTDTVTALRENLHLRRAALLTVEGNGAIGVYVHNAVTPPPPPPPPASDGRWRRSPSPSLPPLSPPPPPPLTPCPTWRRSWRCR